MIRLEQILGKIIVCAFIKLFVTLQNFCGGLAHLARALDWQSKGGRFDPDILHNLNPKTILI